MPSKKVTVGGIVVSSIMAAIVYPARFQTHEATWTWEHATGPVAAYQVKVRGNVEGFPLIHNSKVSVAMTFGPENTITLKAKGCYKIRVRALDASGNFNTKDKRKGWSEWSAKHCPSLLTWG